MRSAAGASCGELPDRVVTLGGESRVYHRNGGTESEPLPRCRAAGGRFYLKKRTLIEPHYDPCGHCFPEAGRDG